MTNLFSATSNGSARNLFCKRSQLGNEATVEAYFAMKLLNHLHFDPEDIKLKTSLKEYKVGRGSKSSLYKPDYVILANRFPSVVVDAKGTDEDVEEWVSQCRSYCLEINGQFEHNPVEYYLLTNGLRTVLYKWDKSDPILEMDFDDFVDGNEKLIQLERTIGKSALRRTATDKIDELMESAFELKPLAPDKLASLFAKIHTFLWKTEKKTPAAAFEELMKVIFVKIKKDRELHEKCDISKLKTKDVIFSVAWIKSQTENENPINDPLFKNLVKDLEREIKDDNKRRIFAPDESINLSPSTIEKIVEDLEHIDFYRTEEDVHGRMFEIFLDATVRGKDLGQFFTPRDIVTLMVKLAGIRVAKNKAETVFDPCCGSGGFLISAMREMKRKAAKIPGLSSTERKSLDKRISNASLFGIDAGSDPAIHRIARMNMYLHGDGGSNIFFADSLHKTIVRVGPPGVEIDKEIDDLRVLLLKDEKRFDVVISNPPFSMTYSRKHTEQRDVLDQYKVSHLQRQSKSILSSVLFLERYGDLVDPNGRILAVIDESVLSGQKFKPIRDYVRDQFIIKGVISLPGDAFRRSAARVKTSILILRPKKAGEEQGDVFMEKSIYLGLSEKTARRIGIGRDELEKGKEEEMDRIVGAYRKFQKGEPSNYIVPADSIADRLDVKNCLGDSGRRVGDWEKAGWKTSPLKELLFRASGRSVKVEADETYRLLKVSYDGEVMEADTKFGEELSYAKLNRVEAWDILFSNMGVGRGSIGIVPDYLSGWYVSNEYTILKPSSHEEALFYANILRTKEVLGDILTSTTGLNRGRIHWPDMGKIIVPAYSKDKAKMKAAVEAMGSLWAARSQYEESRGKEVKRLSTELALEDEEARKRWLAFKPPE